jgi:hypothetical protein
MMTETNEITEFLDNWENGKEHSLESLLPAMENELRQITHRQISGGSGVLTLQTEVVIKKRI